MKPIQNTCARRMDAVLSEAISEVSVIRLFSEIGVMFINAELPYSIAISLAYTSYSCLIPVLIFIPHLLFGKWMLTIIWMKPTKKTFDESLFAIHCLLK